MNKYLSLLFITLLSGCVLTNDPSSTIIVENPAQCRDAIAKLGKNGGVIELKGDSWRFHLDDATNLNFFVSNHDQKKEHLVYLPILNCNNLTFRGNGQTLYFDGPSTPIFITNSSNIRFENLKIDSSTPYLAEAKIKSFENNQTIVSLDKNKFPHSFGEINNDGLHRLVFNHPINPVWTGDAILFDGETNEIIERSADVFFPNFVLPLTNDLFKINYNYAKIGKGAKVGDILCIRPDNRRFPALVIDHSSDIILEDFIIHSAGGMGLIAQMSENITWRGTKVASEKTSGVCASEGRVTTLHADASHFSNVKGRILIENCFFECMMDDALNVHSTALAITSINENDRREIYCKYMHYQSYGFDVFNVGDTIRFIKGKTLENDIELKVAALERLNDHEIKITLSAPLPSSLNVGDAVENATYQPSVNFLSNIVTRNRARGILITTPKPVLIENNLFENVAGSAILFAGDAQGWYESGACKDVTIRNNTFKNCLTSKFQFCEAIISSYPTVRDIKQQRQPYHSGIKIYNNHFETFDIPIFYALSTKNTLWRDNTFSRNSKYQGWGKDSIILLHHSSLSD